MKRGARLAALLAALLVLVGAWYLAANLSHRQQAQQAEEAHEDQLDISTGPEADVSAVAWDYFGDAVSLARKDGQWVNASDGACPIDQDAVKPLVQAVASLTASDRIDDVTDFDQYGLADPAFTVVAASSEQVNTYAVGKQSPTGAYYVRMNGEDTVYVESGQLAAYFQISLDDVLKMEAIPSAEIFSVVDLTVRTDGNAYELRYLDQASDVWYTGAEPWFLVDENGDPVRPLDTEQTEALYGLAADLVFTKCVEWNATDLAGYGLAQPQGTVRVGYLSDAGSLESFTLEFGDYADGDVYVRMKDSRMVYLVSGTVLDGLMYPDFDAMSALDPCALDWDRIESATLDIGDDSYEVVRSVTTPSEEGEEPEDVYTLGQRSLDSAAVAAWQQSMDAMTADSRVDAAQGRETVMTMTFRQDNELYPTVTVEFRGYDSARYLCVVNGEEYYLVTHAAADLVKNDALKFLVEIPTQ